jgi:hypothetical protein
MRSLRTRLLALWLMLAVSAAAIGFVLFEFYRQSANSEVMRAEDAVARSCRDIGERYAFVMVGWDGSTNSIDDTLRQRLVDAVQLAFARAPGWRAAFGRRMRDLWRTRFQPTKGRGRRRTFRRRSARASDKSMAMWLAASGRSRCGRRRARKCSSYMPVRSPGHCPVSRDRR